MNLTSNSLETVQPNTEVSFITRLLSALRPDMVAAEGVTSSHQDASPERFRAVTEIPNDPKLPALVALRDVCLKDAPQADDPGGMTLELLLCGYSEGTRATVEARAGNRRVAVKAYAEDAAPEAELYEALAAAGLGGDSGARVPPLLFWERQLRVLVIGWLEGPTAHDLIKDGRGARAGELAAHWIRRAASLTMKVGPPLGAAQLNAVANVPGLFAYTPPAGTILNAENGRVLTVVFTPANVIGYSAVTQSVSLNILKATPAIAWPRPANLNYGMPLGPAQLNATANVPGSFVYNPSAGAFLNVGANQSLVATFTP